MTIRGHLEVSLPVGMEPVDDWFQYQRWGWINVEEVVAEQQVVR